MSKETKFPARLYRCPGQHNGGKIDDKLRTYNDTVAEDQAALDRLLKAGWSESLPAAAAAEDAKAKAAK